MADKQAHPVITTTPKGMGMALVAYFMWSCFPFYFKQLGEYDAVEIIVHRIVWTLVVLLVFLVMTGRTAGLVVLKNNPKWLGMHSTFINKRWSALDRD